MHCTRSSSGCSSIQGIYAQLLSGGYICLLYICIVWYLVVGIVVCKASMVDLTGESICLLYICILLYLAFGVDGMQGFCAQLTGCLDLAVSVVLCKASLLDLALEGSSLQGFYAHMHCTVSRPSSGCSGMQGISGQLAGDLDLAMGVMVCKASLLAIDWGVHLSSIYKHCNRSSSRCSGMQCFICLIDGGI